MLQLMCFMIYLLRPNFNNFIFITRTLSARSPQLFQNVDEACQIFLKHTPKYIFLVLVGLFGAERIQESHHWLPIVCHDRTLSTTN